MATPCVCIGFKQFFLELYHGTRDNFRPGDGCHFQQYGGQHCSRNITNQVTQAISWPWQSRLRTSDSRLTTSPQKPKTNQTESDKTIRNRLLTLETRRAKWKQSSQVLREQAKNSTCPTCTDRNLIYGSKENARLPWTRSFAEPMQNY